MLRTLIRPRGRGGMILYRMALFFHTNLYVFQVNDVNMMHLISHIKHMGTIKMHKVSTSIGQ